MSVFEWVPSVAATFRVAFQALMLRQAASPTSGKCLRHAATNSTMARCGVPFEYDAGLVKLSRVHRVGLRSIRA